MTSEKSSPRDWEVERIPDAVSASIGGKEGHLQGTRKILEAVDQIFSIRNLSGAVAGSGRTIHFFLVQSAAFEASVRALI